MAENILGGGYLYSSKPFNVINPSGISSEASLDTLTKVGEGSRNRALQRQQMAMESQQAEANRAAEMQMQEKALEDQRAARDFTEKAAARRGLIEQKRFSAQTKRKNALEMGNLDMVREIDAEEDAYEKELGDIDKKLVGANLIESIIKGVNPDSVIKTVEDVTKMAEGRVRLVTEAMPSLTASAIAALSAAENAALSEESRVSSKAVGWLNKKAGLGGPHGGEGDDELTKGTNRRLKAGLETATDPWTLAKTAAAAVTAPQTAFSQLQAGYQENLDAVTAREQAMRAKWGSVATEIAPLVQGSATAEADVTSTIAGLFENLDRAADLTGEARKAAVASARASYEKLRADGADTSALDGLLSGMYRSAGVAKTAAAGAQAMEGAEKQAADEYVPPERGTKPHEKLATMLNLLRAEVETVSGEDGSTTSRSLLRNWGSYSGLGGGMKPNELQDMLKEAVLTVSGIPPAKWMKAVQSMTNEREDDDDPQLKAALSKIPVEYKKKLLSEFKRGLQEAEGVQGQYGLSPEDNVLSLTDRKSKRAGEAARKKGDIRGRFTDRATAANAQYDAEQAGLEALLGADSGNPFP